MWHLSIYAERNEHIADVPVSDCSCGNARAIALQAASSLGILVVPAIVVEIQRNEVKHHTRDAPAILQEFDGALKSLVNLVA